MQKNRGARKSFDIGEIKMEMGEAAEWRCEVCGAYVLADGKHYQLGHRIPQGYKAWLGEAVVYDRDAMAVTCSLECNGKVSLRGKPDELDSLVKKIREKRGFTIPV
jgi:hypothetical protein